MTDHKHMHKDPERTGKGTSNRHLHTDDERRALEMDPQSFAPLPPKLGVDRAFREED